MFEIYRHYKGNHYLRLASSLHSEDLAMHEVYRSLYDNPKSRSWVRPAAMFHGVTEQGQRRFALVGSLERAFPDDQAELVSFRHEAAGAGVLLDGCVAPEPDSRRGERWCMRDSTGETVSVVNVVRFARGATGFASLATSPHHRGKGFEPLLVRGLMELLWMERSAMRFFLFAEAPVEMYERIGFRALSDADQHFKPALAMATGAEPLTPQEQGVVRSYF